VSYGPGPIALASKTTEAGMQAGLCGLASLRSDVYWRCCEKSARRAQLNRADSSMQGRYQVLQLQETLKMLYDLLENYAPPWYTQEHHDKADAALRLVENMVGERRRDAA
jgi:hypothetical protein